MRHYGFAIATASVVALGSLSAGRAEAAPIGAPGGMRTALNALSITEKAQVYVRQGDNVWTLVVSPLTGKVEIAGEALEVPKS